LTVVTELAQKEAEVAAREAAIRARSSDGDQKASRTRWK
jgi:hypothetical protein